MSTILSISNFMIQDIRNDKVLIENLSFKIQKNEIFGIIGENGSGKSLTCKAILGLNSPWIKTSGEILFEGKNILENHDKDWKKIRGKKISLIPQDAINAFNPICKIGKQMIESIAHLKNLSSAKQTCMFWLENMGLKESEKIMNAYPEELSGGMLQRITIALALAQETSLIIADEPTSALDTIHQKNIAILLKNIKNNENRSILFVSHDLGVISYLSDRVLVIKNGKKIELDSVKNIFNSPKNEYTKYLLKTRESLSKRFESCFM